MNPFEGKKELLDQLLVLLESKGVTPPMLDAWYQARGLRVDAEELARDYAKEEPVDGVEGCHTIALELEGQWEATRDDGARDFVDMVFEDVQQAMLVAYTEEERNENLIKRGPK